DDDHLAVLVTWSVYQRIIAAYSQPDRRRGQTMMTAIIDSLRRGVPAVLEELAQLGRTLWSRHADVLAYFDHHASNGPTEAINGRLEALRRNAPWIPESDPLPNPLTTALRQPRPADRCTLIPEEPVSGANFCNENPIRPTATPFWPPTASTNTGGCGPFTRMPYRRCAPSSPPT